MKKVVHYLMILLFVLVTSRSFSQSSKVTIEDTQSAEYIVTQKKYFQLDEEYSKLWGKFSNTKYMALPKKNGMKKDELQKFIHHHEDILYYIQESGFTERCEELNRLKKRLGQYSRDRCAAVNGKVKFLNDNIVWARGEIKKLDEREADDAGAKIVAETERVQHEKVITRLDDEISELDAMLSADNKDLENYKKQQKTQSLNDFLATNNVKKKTTSNDFLAETSGKTNSSNDFLSGSNNGSDDFLADSKSSTNYKIDQQGNKSGVIDDRGKVLIPYKEWEIEEYDLGIAKVRQKFASKTDCSPGIYAYKTGFVGSDGNFIDGFQIEFIDEEPYVGGAGRLVIVAEKRNPYYGTTERDKYYAWERQNEARKREAARKKEQAKKEAELKRKRCQQANNEWKRNILSKYQ